MATVQLRILRDQAITNLEEFMMVFNQDDPKMVIRQIGYFKSVDHRLALTKRWVFAQLKFIASHEDTFDDFLTERGRFDDQHYSQTIG